MKVAIVGSGVSGLAATWLLNGYSNHEVHVYESDSRPGGHANTVHFKPKDKSDGVDVDTGFIVFNPSTYPNFLRFLKQYTNLKILPTEMTFSVSRDNGAFEWAGKNLGTIFCQLSRVLDPTMWRLVYDILRFNACARRLIIMDGDHDVYTDDCSIGEYLRREGYSASFRDNYLIPMTAAIWSTPPDRCVMDFPARTLLQFLNNHHLLQITGKPSWLTLEGGSKGYVNHILSAIPKSNLHLLTPVQSIRTTRRQHRNPIVSLTTADGQTQEYDHVILACHSDTALSILKAGGRDGGLTDEEERILSAFKWSSNEAVLHSDTRFMPKNRSAWSCWNYLTYSQIDENGHRKANCDQVSLTYGMNDLQHLSEEKHGPILVTLNPLSEPDETKVCARFKYDHPIMDAEAIRAQKLIPSIQNTRSISYAGAYLRYGFHEDGFTSGMNAASALLPHSPSSGRPEKMPFEIEMADCVPEEAWFVGVVFDWLEGSGARRVVGAVGALVLAWIAFLVGFFVDIGGEGKARR